MLVKLILISFLISLIVLITSVQDKKNKKKENKGLNEMYVPTSVGQ